MAKKPLKVTVKSRKTGKTKSVATQNLNDSNKMSADIQRSSGQGKRMAKRPLSATRKNLPRLSIKEAESLNATMRAMGRAAVAAAKSQSSKKKK